MVYILLPFVTWLISGCFKFAVNFTQSDLDFRKAKTLIGYGGFPSNHSAISSSIMWYLLLRFGYDTPYFGIAITLVFITVIDARGIRRKVEAHAKLLNKELSPSPLLRERIGHNWFEIAGGLAFGFLSAYLLFNFGNIRF